MQACQERCAEIHVVLLENAKKTLVPYTILGVLLMPVNRVMYARSQQGSRLLFPNPEPWIL